MAVIISIENIDSMVRWRKIVVESVFGVKPDLAFIDISRTYFVRHAADKTFHFLVAFDGDKEVGCGGVCFQQELPSPDNSTGWCGYLMNIYVIPQYRRQGIATQIVRHLVDEALRRGCHKIYLESNNEARGVYENVGFVPMTDMMQLPSNK